MDTSLLRVAEGQGDNTVRSGNPRVVMAELIPESLKKRLISYKILSWL